MASSTEQALHLASLTLLAGGAIGLRHPLPPLEALNLDPLSRWRAADSGCRHRAAQRAGDRHHRICHRAGGYRRLPQRDGGAPPHPSPRRRAALGAAARLTNPELWIERYDSPTWVEYIRQNQRVTQADAEIGQRVRALHRGPNPPVVHRMIERQVGSMPRGTAAAAEPGRRQARRRAERAGQPTIQSPARPTMPTMMRHQANRAKPRFETIVEEAAAPRAAPNTKAAMKPTTISMVSSTVSVL